MGLCPAIILRAFQHFTYFLLYFVHSKYLEFFAWSMGKLQIFIFFFFFFCEFFPKLSSPK